MRKEKIIVHSTYSERPVIMDTKMLKRFLKLPSGIIVNTEHIELLERDSGGNYHVILRSGASHRLSDEDGATLYEYLDYFAEVARDLG